LLIRLFKTYENTLGNDQVRRLILAALGFALSCCKYVGGEYDAALEYIKRGCAKRTVFILLRRTPSMSVPQIICLGQQGLDDFANELSPCADGPFARALCETIRGEPYEAAWRLFEWTFDAADVVQAHFIDRYPVYEFGREGPTEPKDKIDLLIRLFETYDYAEGNEYTRQLILEVLGIALSRTLGAMGEYSKAIGYVERAFKFHARSLHLPACLHALELKSRGLPVPPRLEKFCGHDLHALDNIVCTIPFTDMEITPDGSVHVCCPALVPTKIGNIENESATEILSSEQARKMRHSVLDGSYKYCNHVACYKMIQNELPKRSDALIQSDPVLGPAIASNDDTTSEIRRLAFAYDPSCNLSCPSCRREVLVDKHKQSEARSEIVNRHVAPLLPKLQTLYINNGGEFLYSRPTRALLHAIDPAQHSNLRIDLISNGTLFSEKEWRKFANIHRLIGSVRISTDAATKETFETLRRGGRWESFVENLRFIGGMRLRGEIDCFVMAFTCQLGNFREMPSFVHFAHGLGADRANFERLLPSVAMSDEEFRARAVHLPTHPLHAEFVDVLKDPAFDLPIAVRLFEYGESNADNVEAQLS
jgi:MoaA/NifB/PqqE/SkfB family radical SAM enzyme